MIHSSTRLGFVYSHLKSLVLALMAIGLLIGCSPTTPPKPDPIITVLSNAVFVAEEIGLRAALASGDITQAEYSAAVGVLVVANSEINASGGRLTSDQINTIIADAVSAAIKLAFPVPLPAGAKSAMVSKGAQK